LNSCVEVELIVAVVGLIFTLVTFPKVTFTVPVPLTVPDWAVMVALPEAAAVTTPAVLTGTVDVSELDHTTPEVKLFVVPSSNVPVAVICCLLPWVRFKGFGPTVRDVKVGFTKKPVQLTASASANRAVTDRKTCNLRIEDIW
jgi:hypothetical protein